LVLKRLLKTGVSLLTFDRDTEQTGEAGKKIGVVLIELAGIGAVEIDGNRLRCQVPTERIGALLTELQPYGITTLTCQPPTLEQLFLRHYDRNASVAERASASTASS